MSLLVAPVRGLNLTSVPRYGRIVRNKDRGQRVAELAEQLRALPPNEVGRMALVLLVRTAVSLMLQTLLVGISIWTAGQLYRNRHLGRHRLQSLVVNKPLVVVSVLSVLHFSSTAAFLIRWGRRLSTITSD